MVRRRSFLPLPGGLPLSKMYHGFSLLCFVPLGVLNIVSVVYAKEVFVIRVIGFSLTCDLNRTTAKVPDFVPPGGTAGGGWFRKICGFMVAWKMNGVHRMRRLLQRWEQVPEAKTYMAALMDHVQKYGWTKNLDGEYCLNNSY